MMPSPIQPGLFYDSVDKWDIRIICASIVVARHYSSGQAFHPREMTRGDRMICCLQLHLLPKYLVVSYGLECSLEEEQQQNEETL